MGSIPGICAFLSLSLSAAHAQSSAVRGRVVLQGDGQALPYTTVTLLSQGTQRLTSDSGTFVMIDLPPGELRLRFKRIGFAPKDTLVVLAPSATLRIQVEMTPLAISLPAVVVSGRCTNETPFEPKSAILAELFDQVNQHAERMTLLATAKPFVMRAASVGGVRDPKQPFVPMRVDTLERGPLPVVRYEPKRVARRGTGAYQLVALVARTNRMPSDSRHIADYTHQTRFREVVPGIPVMFEWELRNVFRNGSAPFVQTGTVFDIRWTDSTRARIDTVRRFH